MGSHLVVDFVRCHGLNLYMFAQLILVTTATTGGGVLFSSRRTFSSENAKGTAFSKVYSENIYTNPHILFMNVPSTSKDTKYFLFLPQTLFGYDDLNKGIRGLQFWSTLKKYPHLTRSHQ